jgi:hypothetical protein
VRNFSTGFYTEDWVTGKRYLDTVNYDSGSVIMRPRS